MEYLCLTSTNSEDSSYPEQLLSDHLQFSHIKQQKCILYIYLLKREKKVSQPQTNNTELQQFNLTVST